jgi:hypothetical protein
MQPTNAFKSLQTIFYALLCGQILFLLVAFFLIKKDIFIASKKDLENIFLPVLVIVALLCMVSGNKIFKARLQKLSSVNPITARFSEYRAASLVRWALLEGPCLFAIICFMLTANYFFILIAILILFFFGSTVPAKNKVANDMGISTDELDSIS